MRVLRFSHPAHSCSRFPTTPRKLPPAEPPVIALVYGAVFLVITILLLLLIPLLHLPTLPSPPEMSSDCGSLAPPPPEAAPSISEPSGSVSNSDSESSEEKSPRVMWNYYFEKPHSSQYIPGGRAAAPAGAQPNVESFTQNLKIIGKVGDLGVEIMHAIVVVSTRLAGLRLRRVQVDSRAHLQQVPPPRAPRRSQLQHRFPQRPLTSLPH
jgi:hypothetical protein